MQQGNRSAAAYWVEFQKVKMDLPYDDDICIDRFRQGLDPQVRSHMELVAPETTDLTRYANMAIKADGKMENLGKFPNLRTTTNTPRTGWTSTKPRGTTATGTEPGPMDLDATRRNKFTRSGTPKHLVQCYNCKGFGHMSRDCRKPRQWTKKPFRAAEATFELEGNEADQEQSGKADPQEQN